MLQCEHYVTVTLQYAYGILEKGLPNIWPCTLCVYGAGITHGGGDDSCGEYRWE